MGPNAIVGRRSRKICVLLGAMMLLTPLRKLIGHEVPAESQNQLDRQPTPVESLVIQGRITGIHGTIVTVKLPDGYPGGRGGHAQFVTAGSVFSVDVSHARVLLPDGKQTDKLPLAIGDRVLMVLTGPDAGSKYSASIVERVEPGDKIITH